MPASRRLVQPFGERDRTAVAPRYPHATPRDSE